MRHGVGRGSSGDQSGGTMPRRRVRFVGKRRAGEGEGEWEGEEVTRPRLFRPSAREDPLFGVGGGGMATRDVRASG